MDMCRDAPGHHQNRVTERTTVNTQPASIRDWQETLPSRGQFAYPETDW